MEKRIFLIIHLSLKMDFQISTARPLAPGPADRAVARGRPRRDSRPIQQYFG
jgi:hypothetical protein